jgi:spermidine synthase
VRERRSAAAPRVRVQETRSGFDLRVDGTLASSVRVRGSGVSTGPVWDSLAAAILLVPPAERSCALILGLGGGSVARVLRALAPGLHIVGVERDREVLKVARRFLGLDRLGIEVVTGDALDVLHHETRLFDLVVEDVFVGPRRTVHKPEWLPEPGVALAVRSLKRGGVLASNTIHEGPAMARAFGRHLPHVVSVGVRDHYNHVLIGSRREFDAASLRRQFAAHHVLSRVCRRLEFRTVSGRLGTSAVGP